MFHIDGTQCTGQGCTAVWCATSEPMTAAQIEAEIARVAAQNGWSQPNR